MKGLKMLEDLNVAKVLLEAFDNDETGILLYDKKDIYCKNVCVIKIRMQ